MSPNDSKMEDCLAVGAGREDVELEEASNSSGVAFADEVDAAVASLSLSVKLKLLLLLLVLAWDGSEVAVDGLANFSSFILALATEGSDLIAGVEEGSSSLSL